MDKLTREQAAIISAYTGVLAGPFEDLQAYADRTLGHPTWTHFFALPEFIEELKEKAKPDFVAICADKEG